nr:MAG TPA: helix-turn-helix domain protein [Caudoviricetes sp.]
MTEEYLKQLIAEAIASVAVQPELLKLKDVAAMLSLSQPSVLRLVNAGKIPFVLYESKRMYRRRDVMAYIENMETYKGGKANDKHATA